eukprot:11401952-Karenia_brevis.AAC.1
MSSATYAHLAHFFQDPSTPIDFFGKLSPLPFHVAMQKVSIPSDFFAEHSLRHFHAATLERKSSTA